MTPRVAVPSPLFAAARRLRERRSVIVGGHGVADVPAAYDPENLCVAPDRLRAQVELLLDAGFEFVTVAELTGRMNGGAPPPGLAALSFDDGMDNNVSVLLPLLREYGVPATVYVTTGLIGRPNPWLDPRAGAPGESTARANGAIVETRRPVRASICCATSCAEAPFCSPTA